MIFLPFLPILCYFEKYKGGVRMILCSEQELRRQICRQRIAAELSFAASLLAVLSGGTLILFLFIHDSICIPAACFTVSVLILLLHAWWVRTQKALPARIPLPETLCFEDICERLRAAAVEDTCRESGIPSAAAICRRRACL